VLSRQRGTVRQFRLADRRQRGWDEVVCIFRSQNSRRSTIGYLSNSCASCWCFLIVLDAFILWLTVVR